MLGDGSTGDKPAKLSSQAVVAAHDKDINSIAVAPNDTLICSGSQVTLLLFLLHTLFSLLVKHLQYRFVDLLISLPFL